MVDNTDHEARGGCESEADQHPGDWVSKTTVASNLDVRNV